MSRGGYVYILFALFCLFVFTIYILSVFKAIRDRREMKKRRMLERTSDGDRQPEKDHEGGVHQRFNILIVHDGRREERIKRGSQPRKSLVVTRQGVSSLYLPNAGTSVDPAPVKAIPGKTAQCTSDSIGCGDTLRPGTPSPALDTRRVQDLSNNDFKGATGSLSVASQPLKTPQAGKDLNDLSNNAFKGASGALPTTSLSQTTQTEEFNDHSNNDFKSALEALPMIPPSQLTLKTKDLNDLTNNAFKGYSEVLPMISPSRKIQSKDLDDVSHNVFKGVLKVLPPPQTALQTNDLNDHSNDYTFKGALQAWPATTQANNSPSNNPFENELEIRSVSTSSSSLLDDSSPWRSPCYMDANSLQSEPLQPPLSGTPFPSTRIVSLGSPAALEVCSASPKVQC